VNTAASHTKRALYIAVAISLVILLVGAWLVLYCWYPQAFWQASGVFAVAAYAVWAHLGITALLLLPWRNRTKSRASVQSDVALLVFVMLSAALFSLSYLFAGRPVALVFAVDRVVLVRANEIRTVELATDRVLSKDLRVSGPLQLIAARPSSDSERLNSIQLAMAGYDLHERPGFWIDIDAQRTSFSQKARSVDELDTLTSKRLAEHDNPQANWALFLPLDGVRGNWALILDSGLKAFKPLKMDSIN